MSNQHDKPLSELDARPTRRRRIVLWVLGITVLLLLSVNRFQQLVMDRLPPDTASDTLLLMRWRR